MYKKILVAVNDNEKSYNALQHAADFAQELKARLVILFVLKNEHTQDVVHGEQLAEDAKKIKEKIQSMLPNILIEADFISREGKNVATVIGEIAEETQSDLIVLGSRRLIGPNSLVMRSVTNAVISASKKPVLII